MMINESFDADCNKSIPGEKRGTKTAHPKNGSGLEHLSYKRRHPFELRVTGANMHRIESNMRRLAEEQGTKHPVWAMRAITPT